MTATSQFLRFALVGAAVAALYVVLYLTFLAFGLARAPANGLAFGMAVTLQYIGQARFSFQKRLNDIGQILRFIVMIGAGFLMSTLITSLIGPQFGLPDSMAAILVTVVLPVQNYIIMTLWVFSNQHTEVDPMR